MSKLFSSTIPVALTLAASLLCSAAHAAQHLPSNAAAQQAHGLTRKQVYDQLVQAEKDGSQARINALYEGG
jgi:hypothetical protein